MVDAFVSAHPEISAAALKAGNIEARSLTSDWGIAHATEPDASPFEQFLINSRRIDTASFVRARPRRLSRRQVQRSPVASQCLRQLTPATVFALYRYKIDDDTLRCETAAGDPHGLLLAA